VGVEESTDARPILTNAAEMLRAATFGILAERLKISRNKFKVILISPPYTALASISSLFVGLVLWEFNSSAVPSLVHASGAAEIYTVFTAFTNFDSSVVKHLIIRTVRLPSRALIAIPVGAAPAVAAGARRKGLTRNFGLGLSVWRQVHLWCSHFSVWQSSSRVPMQGLVSFVGAGATAVTVYLLGSFGRGGLTPPNLHHRGVLHCLFPPCSPLASHPAKALMKSGLAGCSVAGRRFYFISTSAAEGARKRCFSTDNQRSR